MIRFNVVTDPPLSPELRLQDYEDVRFIGVEQSGPDIRAVLNSAPVKQLNPYPLVCNPGYLSAGCS